MWYIELFVLLCCVALIYYCCIRIEYLKIDLAVKKYRYKSIEKFIHKKSLDLLCVCDYQTDVNGHQSVFIWKEDMSWHFIGTSHVTEDFVRLKDDEQ